MSHGEATLVGSGSYVKIEAIDNNYISFLTPLAGTDVYVYVYFLACPHLCWNRFLNYRRRVVDNITFGISRVLVCSWCSRKSLDNVRNILTIGIDLGGVETVSKDEWRGSKRGHIDTRYDML